MSVVKTLWGAVLLAAASFGGEVAYGGTDQTSLAQVFAGCIGRYSAEREHAWLMSDPSASEMEAQRMVFTSLLEATLPQEQARAMLSYRIEVKLAHAALLTRATFGTDTNDSLRAERLASAHIAGCRDLLLRG